ncbi:uncharacterized protein [Pyxicephalus adspersus]|uniref:uncharacterized protein n=1 Tax=Pyxicephalus adspersus TaxID=30357 RepID=UPI003B5C7A49
MVSFLMRGPHVRPQISLKCYGKLPETGKTQQDKMKTVIVWLCLLSKVSTFPTEPPPNAKEEKPCCVEQPRLLLKGYDSKHGVNIYLFEFTPQKDVSKSNVKEENAKPPNTTSEGRRNSSEDGTQNKFAATETNTPDYPQDFVIPQRRNNLLTVNTGGATVRETPMNLSLANIHQNKLDTKNNISTKTITQNVTEMYRKVKNDIEVGDEAKGSEVENSNNDVDGYYSTDLITFTDIPSYSDTKVTEQDPNLRFPSKDVGNGQIVDCSETDGLCSNTSQYTEQRTVIHPATHKTHYPTETVTQSSKIQINKPTDRHTKPVTQRDNKQPHKPKINNRQSPITYLIPRYGKGSSTQSQRYAPYDRSHYHLYYRHHHIQSSSESASDSSQQLG